jgi:ABC-type branched-subunit amino acid transport system substrate-binding protein
MQTKILGIVVIVIIAVAAIAAWQLAPTFSASQPSTSPSPSGAASSDARPIKIGLVAPYQKAEGEDMDRAARLAVKEINDAGGIYVSQWNTKVPIELVVADTQDDSSAKSVDPVKKIVTQDKDDLLIGGYASSGTLANKYTMDNACPISEPVHRPL